MPVRRFSVLLCALLAAASSGCERAPEAEPTPQQPAAADPALYPVEIEPGIALAVRKTGSREYMLYGSTDRASTLRLSVEDGHNVLFGPAQITVEQQRFRIEFLIEPTDRDHIFFYITDGAGERLAVVPVDTARGMTTAGPADRLPPPPEAGAGRVGDRRTRVGADGLESPHFRVRWPQVHEGDRAIQLHGETDLQTFRAEVHRQNRVLVSQQPRVAGQPTVWNRFATELLVPGGIREGDAVVLATGAGEDAVELIFQPIRN
jgi:hypothetical protein